MLKNVTDRFKKYIAELGSNDDELIDKAAREKVYSSAKSGNIEDQYGYACLCFSGIGGPVIKGHFEYWLNMAASKGHVEAQCTLGEFYFHGYFLEKNLEKGKYWLIIAATNENQVAKDYVESEFQVETGDWANNRHRTLPLPLHIP